MEILKSLQGVKSFKQYFVSNSILVEGDRSVVEALSNHPDVIEIHPNRPFSVPLFVEELPNVTSIQSPADFLFDFFSKQSKPTQTVQWNIKNVNADKVWEYTLPGSKGRGTVYANADTGIAFNHQSINSNYRGRLPDGKYNHNYCNFS